jgi:hypothetical protein
MGSNWIEVGNHLFDVSDFNMISAASGASDKVGRIQIVFKNGKILDLYYSDAKVRDEVFKQIKRQILNKGD